MVNLTVRWGPASGECWNVRDAIMAIAAAAGIAAANSANFRIAVRLPDGRDVDAGADCAPDVSFSSSSNATFRSAAVW